MWYMGVGRRRRDALKPRMLGFHIIRAGKVIICNECSRVLTSRQGAKEQPLAGQNMRAEAAEAGQETSSTEGWRMPYPR
jgi:hypothetical protein